MAVQFRIISGRRYKTHSGRAFTVVRRFAKPGSGTRQVVMVEVKWDGDEGTYEITRRMFNKMVSGWDSGQPQPQPNHDTRPGEVPVGEIVVDEEQHDEDYKPSPLNSDLAKAIAVAVAPHVKAGIDREQVERIVDERIVDSLLPRRIEVPVLNADDYKDVGIQHTYFEALVRMASARLPVYLVGPAGGGKTTIADSVGKALGLQAYATSVCGTSSKADLLGYRNVMDGAYVQTDLRQAYEHGGVFLLDEVDAGNPNVMVIMNALLANGRSAFPDGMVNRHPDFMPIAGANTIGMGADKQYVGRNKLDEATRDRFLVMELPYDPTIEAVMCGVCPTAFAEADRPQPYEFIQVEDKADAENDKRLKADAERRCFEYCKRVVKIRKACESLRVRHLISPRATKAGCTLIRLGFTTKDVMNLAVWKGLDADTVSKIENNI
jgi:cobaltochelatase CobS